MGRRKKPKLINEVEITGLADRGKSVGRDADGEVVFVERVAPGDIVDVLVLRKKKGVMQGVPQHFHKYSEDRQEPFCSHFGSCGGCKLQHIQYEAQIKHKQQIVFDAIKRIAKIDIGDGFLPILPAIETDYYRNKMEFTFSNKRWLQVEELNTSIDNKVDVLGFHPGGSYDKVVDVNHCFLQLEPSNNIRNTIKAIAIEQGLEFYDASAKTGYLRNVIVRITTLGQVMLIFSLFHDDKEMREQFFKSLLKACPEINALYFCINSKVNDFIMDLDFNLYHGEECIEEVLGDIKFKIGPKSFFQTNSRQAVRLFDVVKSFAGLSGKENVYDLYTGLGSIALYLAKACKQVVGIEEIESAIEDAKINADINQIENAIFYAGDVKNILTTEFAQEHGAPDVVITDPPRSGMHANVVQMLLQLASPKIVYVSCNPATQARDLNLLKEKYTTTKIQPVDMFPHTHHIESVALLELK